jgi:hypothetical protein
VADGLDRSVRIPAAGLYGVQDGYTPHRWKYFLPSKSVYVYSAGVRGSHFQRLFAMIPEIPCFQETPRGGGRYSSPFSRIQDVIQDKSHRAYRRNIGKLETTTRRPSGSPYYINDLV